jgi:hypothetical protein
MQTKDMNKPNEQLDRREWDRSGRCLRVRIAALWI